MEDLPPSLPVARREALLRGPLILTLIARLVFGFIFCVVLGIEGGKLLDTRHWSRAVLRSANERIRFAQWHMLLDLVVPFALLMFNVVLTVLFFKRHRAFRPLMIYYSVFLIADCWGEYALDAYHPEYAYTNAPPTTYVPLIILTTMAAIWIPYYLWSKRVRRIFVR